jgi:hypothetical protein
VTTPHQRRNRSRLHEAGLLNEAAFVTFTRGFGVTMRLPGARAAWKTLSGNFNPGLGKFMDGLLAANLTSEAYLLSPARWKVDAAREQTIATVNLGGQL